ncbi:MAG: hypothetical protein H6Q69_1530 [Firmicutes bacterium]|nr:hypothetical protein [Bacillota bacterium]
MELNLINTVQIIVIISFTAKLVQRLIVSPLQKAIDELQQAVEKMEKMLTNLSDDQKNIDKRLVAVEELTKSAHKRIDGLEVHSNEKDHAS